MFSIRSETPAAAAALSALAAIALAACNDATSAGRFGITGTDGVALTATALAQFDEPWAMSFLPDGRAVVTERTGGLWLLKGDGSKAGPIGNAPLVVPRNQGGLGDIIVHPEFATNGRVFVSYVERDAEDPGLSGAVVERAILRLRRDGGELRDREVIWRQVPKVTGNGHYGHRLVISAEGYLFVSSGERQKFTPAQDMQTNLGKIVRLRQDGSVPEGNPFAGQSGVTEQIWSLGHRNPLGLAFDAAGRLWEVEMGPRGGDELNRIVRGGNYGYPEVSEGRHYSGREIPDHSTRPQFIAPVLAWTPVISPGALTIYTGALFPGWEGDAFIAGLSSRALVRVTLATGGTAAAAGRPQADDRTAVAAREAARYGWGARVREVEQGPDGALYVLEDGAGGRLLRLTPGSGGGTQ